MNGIGSALTINDSSKYLVVSEEATGLGGVSLYQVTESYLCILEEDNVTLIVDVKTLEEWAVEVVLVNLDSTSLRIWVHACADAPNLVLVHERLEVDHRHLVDDIHHALGIGVATSDSLAQDNRIEVDDGVVELSRGQCLDVVRIDVNSRHREVIQQSGVDRIVVQTAVGTVTILQVV